MTSEEDNFGKVDWSNFQSIEEEPVLNVIDKEQEYEILFLERISERKKKYAEAKKKYASNIKYLKKIDQWEKEDDEMVKKHYEMKKEHDEMKKLPLEKRVEKIYEKYGMLYPSSSSNKEIKPPSPRKKDINTYAGDICFGNIWDYSKAIQGTPGAGY